MASGTKLPAMYLPQQQHLHARSWVQPTPHLCSQVWIPKAWARSPEWQEPRRNLLSSARFLISRVKVWTSTSLQVWSRDTPVSQLERQIPHCNRYYWTSIRCLPEQGSTYSIADVLDENSFPFLVGRGGWSVLPIVGCLAASLASTH